MLEISSKQSVDVSQSLKLKQNFDFKLKQFHYKSTSRYNNPSVIEY